MKILVYSLLVIFLEICNGEVTNVQPKDPANDCGFDYGGPLIQQVTKTLKSPIHPYWSDKYKKLYFSDQIDDKVYIYDPKTGDLNEINIHDPQLDGNSIEHFIPIQHNDNYYWLITVEQIFMIEILYKDGNYVVTDMKKVAKDKDLIVKQGRTDKNGFDSRKLIFDASTTDIQGEIVDIVFDSQDNIWIAFSETGTIIKCDSSNSSATKYEMTMPEESISGMSWGGAEWDTLYVLTRRNSLHSAEHPAAGAVFAVSGLDARGVPYSRY